MREYRNVFAECGYDREEITQRLEQIFQTLFFGTKEERIYEAVGDDMGYLTDTGNHDVRTEGMSYGMMMCVQMNRKDLFDRLWKWTRTYMYLESGNNSGYFCWSNQLDGTKNSDGPAPDGEEYFAMALFFASHRFGNGEGIFNYEKEAQDLLHIAIGKSKDKKVPPLWDTSSYLIRFIAGIDFTDPSYHLPHFYELFGKWAYEEDREFFLQAAKQSRLFLHTACDPVTGLAPEYANDDGSAHHEHQEIFGSHDNYYSDAYRVALNIGLDYEWFHKDEWESDCADRIQKFFCETVKGEEFFVYTPQGEKIDQQVLHPVAIIATNAAASLASHGKYASECVKHFWDTPLRSGDRRYYDNCLYFFSFLALSGNYRIYE